MAGKTQISRRTLPLSPLPSARSGHFDLCDTGIGDRLARSLAERLRALEQQKARLAEQEAKLKDAGRKARTRRLIEAGALVEKTGLLDLDANALYGALLSLRDGASNTRQVEQWAALGGRAFAREAGARNEGKEPVEPVVLTFPNPLPKEATAPLRAAGFRFNKVFQHWEGMTRFNEAEQLAGANAGTARRVTHPAPPVPPDTPDTAAA